MSKTKIAWIEDDINIIEDVIEPLKRANYQIYKYFSPSDALKEIDTIKNVDAILVDMIIEPLEGLESSSYPGKDLIQKLNDTNGFNVPIIVFTIARNESLIKRLKSMGVKEIIQKPVLPSELKNIVDEVIKKNN